MHKWCRVAELHRELQSPPKLYCTLHSDQCVDGVGGDTWCACSVAELTLELQQLRHCLAVVTRVAAVELAVLRPALFPPRLKRLLWGALAPWSQEASPDAKPGTYRAEVRPRTVQPPPPPDAIMLQWRVPPPVHSTHDMIYMILSESSASFNPPVSLLCFIYL